jgi:hypothetical protein
MIEESNFLFKSFFFVTALIEIKAPEEVWKLIKKFWDDNGLAKGKPENWGIGKLIERKRSVFFFF